jgi:hypothetical protein
LKIHIGVVSGCRTLGLYSQHHLWPCSWWLSCSSLS